MLNKCTEFFPLIDIEDCLFCKLFFVCEKCDFHDDLLSITIVIISKLKFFSKFSSQYSINFFHAASEKKKSNETSKNVKSEKTKAQLNRKENWLCSWEKKLMGVENELEARVGWIKKTEGKIMREERRLAEKEALLNYREQLLMNVPLDNDEGVKKILEEAMKRLKEFARWIDEQGSTFEKNGSKEVELETTNTPTLSSGADFADDVK